MIKHQDTCWEVDESTNNGDDGFRRQGHDETIKESFWNGMYYKYLDLVSGFREEKSELKQSSIYHGEWNVGYLI